MTTHIVEITHPSKPGWAPLTGPITELEAKSLTTVIGGGWLSRIVPAALPTDWEAEEQMMLERFGDPNQVARRADGMLPVEELRAVIGGELFGALRFTVMFCRWQPLRVTHHPDCVDRAEHGEWTVDPAEIMTGNEWLAMRSLLASLSMIRRRIDEYGLRAEVKALPAKLHSGACKTCGGNARGISVPVQISWGPHKMVREFAL